MDETIALLAGYAIGMVGGYLLRWVQADRKKSAETKQKDIITGLKAWLAAQEKANKEHEGVG